MTAPDAAVSPVSGTPGRSRRGHTLSASAGDVLPLATHGDGLRVWDAQGREYLDACGGAMVTLLGHRHPRLVAAARRQLDQLTFAYRFSFSTEPALELAELLRQVAPMPDAWSLFNSSGSESVESAIHLALLYWQRCGQPGKTELLGRYPGFHGSTMGALSLSGSKWRVPFEHLLAPNAVAEAPWADIRARSAAGEAVRQGLHELERAILERGAERVAAVFLEPITGASGAALVPPDGYLQGVRELCDRHDVLLVADETITGFGRTGTWWASEHWGVAPDIATFAKGVTSGIVPFSGVLVGGRVARVMQEGGGFPYGHTFSGSPLGCAVACETIRVIRDEDLLARSTELGALLRSRLDEVAAGSPQVGEVRGRGLLLGLELVEDRETLTPLAGGSARLQQLARDRGLMIYACPTPLRDTVIEAVLLAPPLTAEPGDLEKIVHRLADALQAMGTAR